MRHVSGMGSAVSTGSFSPWFFSMSKRQCLALAWVFLGCGAAAAAMDLVSQVRLGGLTPVGVGVSVNTGVFVLGSCVVGAVIGAVLSLPVLLVFHYATPKTRGAVRFVVILVAGLAVAGWLYWVFIPALEHAF